jgi:hypothetical protein
MTLRGCAVDWLVGSATLVVCLLLAWAIHNHQAANSDPRGSVPAAPTKPAPPQPPLEYRLLLPC